MAPYHMPLKSHGFLQAAFEIIFFLEKNTIKNVTTRLANTKFSFFLFNQRNNFNIKILFEVVRCCALTTDFEQLPMGDKTIVGERASLSGQ